MTSIQKTPRLYTAAALMQDGAFSLNEPQTHYVRNVMRLKEGGHIRAFNGRDGEFAAVITGLGKKSAALLCTQKLKQQPQVPPRIHLLFAPLKKHRMDQIIEKTVELGVTDLHPIITAHTEVRSLNTERLTAQMIEAAEQSERLEIPVLHPITTLYEKMKAWDKNIPLFWATEAEKDVAPALTQALKASAFLIGPVGGFNAAENASLSALPFIKPVSLGPRVLRAETAAIYCVVLANP